MALKDEFINEMCYKRCKKQDCKQTKTDINNCGILVFWKSIYKKVDISETLKNTLNNEFIEEMCSTRCKNKTCKRAKADINHCAILITWKAIYKQVLGIE